VISTILGWLSGFKGWLYAALAAAIVGAGLWAYWHGRAVGDSNGAARIQKRWDKNLADIAALAAKAEADNAAALREAQERNRSIVDDYQKRIADSDARGADLARRLRNATIAARRSAVPQACPEPGTAPASGTAGDDEITRVAGDANGECLRNADRLDTILMQLRPQL